MTVTTYKSGTPAPETGFYVFHAYVDGSTTPRPSDSDRTATYQKGQTFKQLNGRDVFWVKKSS